MSESVSKSALFILGLLLAIIAVVAIFSTDSGILTKLSGFLKYLMKCVFCKPLLGSDICHSVGTCPF